MVRFNATASPPPDDPDVRLMLDFQKGDTRAFEALLRRHHRGVLNFTYRLVGRGDIAEELTHEAFIRVYQGAASYTPRSRFRTWLYTIAKNLSLNELRRRQHQAGSLDELLMPEGGGPVKTLPDAQVLPPDAQMIRRERIAAIRAAIDTLPENQRLAVVLRRYEQFSYEEIAATLNVTEKAVKSLLSRAKVHLRLRLASWADPG